MDDFRSLLLSLGNDIEQKQFEYMKFYCKSQIGAAILERMTLPIHLFDELEKRTLLGPTKKDFLAYLLDKVGRTDLKNKLLGIVGKPNQVIVIWGIWTDKIISPLIRMYYNCDIAYISTVYITFSVHLTIFRVGASQSIINCIVHQQMQARFLFWKTSAWDWNYMG